jgi:hypothetical protein
MTISNDELIKLRSRMFRGYRAPVATTNFFEQQQIVSIHRNADGNIDQTVHQVTFEDGTQATRTTDYTLDGTGNVTSSNVTYSYDDLTP